MHKLHYTISAHLFRTCSAFRQKSNLSAQKVIDRLPAQKLQLSTICWMLFIKAFIDDWWSGNDKLTVNFDFRRGTSLDRASCSPAFSAFLSFHTRSWKRSNKLEERLNLIGGGWAVSYGGRCGELPGRNILVGLTENHDRWCYGFAAGLPTHSTYTSANKGDSVPNWNTQLGQIQHGYISRKNQKKTQESLRQVTNPKTLMIQSDKWHVLDFRSSMSREIYSIFVALIKQKKCGSLNTGRVHGTEFISSNKTARNSCRRERLVEFP